MRRKDKTKARVKLFLLFMGVMALVFSVSACSDDDSTGTNENNDFDAAVEQDASVGEDASIEEDGAVGEDGEVPKDAEVEVDGDVNAGEATVVMVHLHDADQWSLDLETMGLTEGTVTGHHLLIVKDDGAYIALGDGVTGVDMGNTQDYHDINEAPESGYLGDDPEPLIGWGWKAGGSGTTGFDMTENVYVLQLADGTYAKVEVLSAVAGNIEILCYRQSDGTRNITTAP